MRREVEQSWGGIGLGVAVALAATSLACGGSQNSAQASGVLASAAGDDAVEALRIDAHHAKRADALLAQLTLDDEITLVTGASKASTDPILSAGYIPAIKHDQVDIPAIYLGDSPNGVGNGNTGVTRFPTGISVSASWSTDLAGAFGDALGAEWSGKGENVGLGPAMNIIRLPQNGRNAEYYSEDPYLAGRIASREIQGIQARHVIATAKHFALNNQETSRSGVDVVVSERVAREIYLPAFEASVKEGGVGAIMCSYNRIAGTYACEDPRFLEDILRTGWSFDGFVMSDWGANHSTVAAALAGLDQEMPGTAYAPFIPSYFGPALKAAVEAGTVPRARLDTMVRHILTAMYRVGLFDHRVPTTPAATVSTDAHRALGIQLSEEGSVLLKNRRDLLPLAKSAHVAVIGPGAQYQVQSGIGGSGAVNPVAPVVTPLAGVTSLVGASQVTYAQGSVGSGSLPILTGGAGGNATVFTANDGTDVAGFAETLTASDGTLILQDVLTRIDRGACGLALLGACTVDAWPTQPQNLGDGSVRGWKATYTGYITIATAQSYQFALGASGAATLSVDNTLQASVSTTTTSDSKAVRVTLPAGVHRIDVSLDSSAWTWPVVFGTLLSAPSVVLTWNPNGDYLTDALAAARAADVALVFVGDAETEGADHALLLPGDQNDLVAAVAAVAKKTVVVLNTGSALLLPWADSVDAILENWYGGEDLGTAIAAMLFGDAAPSGKSPVTFARAQGQLYAQQPSEFPGVVLNGESYPTVDYTEGLLVGYRWFDATSQEPLFPFGHGLTYTTFAYRDAAVFPSVGRGDFAVVAVKLQNTGRRAGKEVAQVYVEFPAVSGEPPHQLKAFQKVSLGAGKSAQLLFSLDARSFSRWADSGWKVDRGTYKVWVGGSSRDLKLAGTYTVR